MNTLVVVIPITDSLRSILEAACHAGYRAFGVSEHMPRTEPRYLYATERQKGWTVQTLESLFERYTVAVREHAQAFAGQLTVLCGFELEVVPPDRWVQLVERYRPHFDYIVGSVHFVRGAGIFARYTFTPALPVGEPPVGVVVATASSPLTRNLPTHDCDRPLPNR
jgi:HisJ family histidinol phosphate phosphatase